MSKRILLLCFIVVFMLSACSVNVRHRSSPRLYYPTAAISYGIDAKTIQPSSDDPVGGNIDEILRNYLKGPNDPNFVNPFPKGTSLLSCVQENDVTTIVLTDRFADLTGIQLTTACVCLAKTAMVLTGTHTVTICCESRLLDGDEAFTVTNESILLVDDSTDLTAYATAAPNNNE